MKKVKIIIAIILSALVLNGCNSSKKIETICITGGPGQDSCLFEIIHNQSIKITSGNVFYDDVKKEAVLGNDIQEKTIQPNSKDWEKINDLLLLIRKKGEDKIMPSSDDVEITAIINGKKYWTSLYCDRQNENLLNLTETLIELSPIKVGGELNPIYVPKTKE